VIEPLVSIIVPVYNTSKYVVACIKSIQQFEYSNYEVLIGDDGSTDNSYSITRKVTRDDPRFYLYKFSNQGVSITRNRLLTKAQGKYIIFLDSDDVFNPHTLGVMVNSLEESHSPICVAKYLRLQNGKLSEPGYWIQDVHSIPRSTVVLEGYPKILCQILAAGKLFNFEWWKTHKFAFPEGIIYEDHIMNIKCYLAAPTIDVIPDNLVYWRIRDDSSSISQNINLVSDTQARIRSYTTAIDLLRATGNSDLVKTRVTQYLSFDVPEILRHLLESEELSVQLKLVRRFVETIFEYISSDDHDLIPPASRFGYELLVHRQNQALINWIKYTELLNQKIIYQNLENQASLNIQATLGFYSLDSRIFQANLTNAKCEYPVTELQIFPIHFIQCHFRKFGYLYVKGWAFLADLDPGFFEYSYRAELIDSMEAKKNERSGLEADLQNDVNTNLDLPIRHQVNSLIARRDKNPIIDFTSCGFVIFTKVLPEAGNVLRLHITAGNYTRVIDHALT
jgi:glycosyltransferase involved in cell wall biosynthesis